MVKDVSAGLDYAALADLVRQHDLPYMASEVHGLLCGVAGADDWQSLARAGLGGAELDARLPERLAPFYEAAHTMFFEENLAFSPLLPDDTIPIPERVESIAAWCRGFTLGLVSRGMKDMASLSAEAQEALQDILSIQEVVSEQGGEDAERALTEIEEYVRVAAPLLHEELGT